MCYWWGLRECIRPMPRGPQCQWRAEIQGDRYEERTLMYARTRYSFWASWRIQSHVKPSGLGNGLPLPLTLTCLVWYEFISGTGEMTWWKTYFIVCVMNLKWLRHVHRDMFFRGLGLGNWGSPVAEPEWVGPPKHRTLEGPASNVPQSLVLFLTNELESAVPWFQIVDFYLPHI